MQKLGKQNTENLRIHISASPAAGRSIQLPVPLKNTLIDPLTQKETDNKVSIVNQDL